MTVRIYGIGGVVLLLMGCGNAGGDGGSRDAGALGDAAVECGGGPGCGDGVCGEGETCSSCASDCGGCTGAAAKYYVSTSGSDENDGSQGSPFRTIQKAVDTAAAGETVQVGAGVYEERVTFHNSGVTVVGVRGSDGSFETVVDGSNVATGWVPADEIGSGVWKAELGYAPGAMTADGKAIWKISDPAMDGTAFGSEGNGFDNLTRPSDAMVSYFGQTVPAWDGIEALFGNKDGVTYLRFRDGDNPESRNVRGAPHEAVMKLAGVNEVVLRDLRIVGGRYGVYLGDGADHNTIDGCYIANGERRVWIDGASNTTVKNSKLTLDGIGFVNFTGGAWYDAVHRNQYGMNKFVIGTTDTDDCSIMVASGSGATDNTTIVGNELFSGQLGMQISETTSNTFITNNTFHHFSDTSVYIYPDSASVFASGNFFNDATHHFRHNNLHRDLDVYIYGNRFYEPGGGKHVHLSPDNSQVTDARVWVYHNSFAGKGWAVDVGFEGTSPNLPNVHVLNNFLSSDGLTSGPSPDGWAVGENYEDEIWHGETIPDYILPSGHPALDSAPSLLDLGLPGMTADYYRDGNPDYGAAQAGVVTGP